MSRLRVVFSIGALHGGGSERQLVSLLRGLDRKLFQPFLYLVYRSGPLLSLVPDDVPVTSFADRVTPSRIYLPGLMHQLRVRDFAGYLREIRADVSYDRTFLMTLISAAAAQRIGVPNVSTIVTDPQTGFAPVAGRFQWFKRRILHRLYNHSSRVLAVSDGVRESAVSFYGIRPDRIQTLRNGIDVELIRGQAEGTPDNAWWTDQERDPHGEPLVRLASAGRLNEQKGFHVLIDALAELRQLRPRRKFRLAILGEGPAREQLQTRIRQRDLADHVLLPGFQMNAAAWYRTADIFVLPSLVEGMPNVLLEAMALGTPVISTDCRSGPREILRDGTLGQLVTPGSSSSLRDGLLEMIDNPETTRRKAAAAAEIAATDYSITTAVRQLEQILLQAGQRIPAGPSAG